jgi:CheY-like chemotaxis protein
LTPALAFNRKATVLVADDHAEMLKTVTNMLTPHFEVVAAVGDGKAALDAAARTDPNVALLDMAMPRLNGIQAAKELREQNLEAKVIFLTA